MKSLKFKNPGVDYIKVGIRFEGIYEPVSEKEEYCYAVISDQDLQNFMQHYSEYVLEPVSQTEMPYSISSTLSGRFANFKLITFRVT